MPGGAAMPESAGMMLVHAMTRRMDTVLTVAARLRVSGRKSDYAGEHDKCGSKFRFHHHSTVEGP
jgi:hypothetical protein